MAFSVNGGSNRSRGRFQPESALSEINVTPFVDVLLVLLIIFMLTAHVMESGIEVDVPKVKTTRDTVKELPVVTVTKDAQLYLGDRKININELVAAIQQKFGSGKTVYVKADKETPFDPIAQVLSELGAAKIGVSVVTKPEENARGRK